MQNYAEPQYNNNPPSASTDGYLSNDFESSIVTSPGA